MATRRQFLVGDPAPDFNCPSSNNPRFHFSAAAGRYIVLCFFGSAGIEKNATALRYAHTGLRTYFNDSKTSFFGVTIDPPDKEQERVRQEIPGYRYFWDFDQKVSELYGAVTGKKDTGANGITYRPFTLVLDPNLRVLANIPLKDTETHNRTLESVLKNLPPLDDYAEVPLTAPVLVVPRVFEPKFCRKLIALYESEGGRESGSMTERDGMTVGKIDYGFKRRKDCDITDPELQREFRARLNRRLLPEIFKAFQFRATRIERYIVACYEGEEGGFFRAHRDNTTKGTAHRKFACTINLNAEDYEGGNLRFPEFGSRTYRAPTGGAVVFSCSLLHEATPVTKGRRYATLPFLYDAEGERIRNQNLAYLSGEVINLNPHATGE